ncbi:hypothetical protein C8Q80DRAFT_484323 [Daedaleopsis nitida]|nr:hypothetical protein C8Q80DRAFT_484323 [Daedaleopsis nitida]
MPQAFNDTPISDVIVDDGDIDQIHYYPAMPTTYSSNPGVYNDWTHGSNTYIFHMTTNSMCAAPGCSFVFRFKGTRVAVYGNSVDAVSLYTLDDGDPKTYSLHNPVDPRKRTGPVSSTLYQSEEIPFGQHTLIVNLSSISTTGANYILDWIEYNTTARLPLSTSFPSGSTTTAASGSSTDRVLSKEGSSTFPVGAIAGCAIGGVFVLVFTAILASLFFRRRRRRAKLEGYDYMYGTLDDPCYASPEVVAVTARPSLILEHHLSRPTILPYDTSLPLDFASHSLLTTSRISSQPATSFDQPVQAHHVGRSVVSREQRLLAACPPHDTGSPTGLPDEAVSPSSEQPPAYSP